jgi:predicted ABC-type ATPase
MRPRMIVVAGPPGSGKSSLFSAGAWGVDAFNADDEAALLNGGSYQAISAQIRQTVNRQFEEFILRHISEGISFAFETTLRTPVPSLSL